MSLDHKDLALSAASSEQQAMTGRPAAPKTATGASTASKNTAQKTPFYCPDSGGCEKSQLRPFPRRTYPINVKGHLKHCHEHKSPSLRTPVLRRAESQEAGSGSTGQT